VHFQEKKITNVLFKIDLIILKLQLRFLLLDLSLYIFFLEDKWLMHYLYKLTIGKLIIFSLLKAQVRIQITSFEALLLVLRPRSQSQLMALYFIHELNDF
jgi:hypothetical protein